MELEGFSNHPDKYKIIVKNINQAIHIRLANKDIKYNGKFIQWTVREQL